MCRKALSIAVSIALSAMAAESLASDLTIWKSAPATITEDTTCTGSYDIGINASGGNTFEFSGKTLSLDITNGGGGQGTVGIKADYASASASQQNTITLGQQGTTESITVKVKDDSGTAKISRGIWARGEGTAGSKGGVININTGSLVVDVTSKAWVYAIQSQNFTSGATSNLSTLNITADNIYINATTTGARTDGYEAHAIVVMSQGQMTINGNLEAHATTGAISARGNSVLKINEDGAHTTKLYGNIDFNYDASTSGTVVDSTVLVNFSGKDSIWVGNSSVSYGTGAPATDDYLKVNKLEVALKNGATWEPTVVNEASYSNDDKVNYTPLNLLTLSDATINIKNSTQEVVVEKLQGTGGTINVAATTEDGKTLTTGKFKVTSLGEEASPKLNVALTGLTADAITDAQAAATSAASAITGDASSSINKTIAIAEGAVKGAITANVTGGDVDTVSQTENAKLTALNSVSAMGTMAWRHDLNDLTKRMGELRTSPEGIGSWVRLYGSKQEYGRQNVTSKSTSVQVGSDYDVGYGWKVGGAFTYTDGSSDYADGSADNKAYGIAAYGSWLHENGAFVDLIAKYSRLKSDFDLSSMSGTSKNNAYSASAEFGWYVPFAKVAFVEPQAELTYGVVKGDDFTTSNGVVVSQKDTKALIGRLGVRTGLHFNENKGVAYVRASVLRDFKGESEFTASLASDSSVRSTIKDDIGGTYYEIGIGANYKFTDNAYTYVDFERQNGGDVKEKWRWNVGFRYVW